MDSFEVSKEIVMIKTDEIKPYPGNPRENDQTVDKLVKLIPLVGFNVPLLLDKDKVIVKGHARWKAAKILGMEDLPCIISKATDDQNKVDRISDNRIQEFSLWLGDYLKSELTMLNMSVKDLELENYYSADENKFIDNPIRIGPADMLAADRAIQHIPQTVSYIKCVCEKCQNVWFVENNKGVFLDYGNCEKEVNVA